MGLKRIGWPFAVAAIAFAAPPARAAGLGGRDWAFEPANGEEPAKLAYGAPESDDVDLLLWCDPSGGQVQFTPVGADDQHFRRLTVRSDGRSARLRLVQDPLRGSLGVLSRTNPLFAAFAVHGRLKITLDDARPRSLDAASASGRRQVRAFLKACAVAVRAPATPAPPRPATGSRSPRR